MKEIEIAAKRFKECLEDNKDYELMIQGKEYNSMDEDLVLARTISSELAAGYAQIKVRDYDYDVKKHKEAQSDYLSKYVFFQENLKDIYIEPPFYVDFGCHIKFGKNFYANFNTIFLDCAPIIFGDNVLVGPNVTFSTAGHPTEPSKRLNGEEFAYPITVGNNVWFGGSCIILPGVTIGDGSVIGAGSVVNKDIEANCVAVGVPVKVIKRLGSKEEKEQAKVFLKK